MGVSLEQFVGHLTASGLMSAEDISSFQGTLPPDKRPKDAEALARALVQANKLTKYQVAAVYQGKTKGLIFGEYVVIDKLGQGGMGVVLKARHRRMDRLVAVKMIAGAALKSPDAVKRFYREVKAAARLNHTNIVTAYDASEHEGVHYLVMEFVEGKDLGATVKDKGQLPIAQAVDYIIQAARGLQYAHEQGIVHRDIKPANLLVDKRGTVKILDMGLARVGGLVDEADQDRLTASGQVMGTCDYMAPEQAVDTHHADHRADIYALGCTLYRLLTGMVLYQGDTLTKILLAHQLAPIPSLCQSRPEVPPPLDAVFQKMVAKKPDDRHQSMAAVISDLETCIGRRDATSTLIHEGATAAFAMDDNLSFLKTTSPAKTATATREQVAAAAEVTLVEQTASETSRELSSDEKLSGLPRKKKTLPLAIGLGVLGIVGIVALVVVLRIRRPDGKETVIALPDGSNVAVSEKGDVDVTVPVAGGKPAATPSLKAPPPARGPADTTAIRSSPVADWNVFVGEWNCGDIIITLNADFTARKNNKKNGDGKWQFVDGEARISWNDRMHNTIRREGDGFQKLFWDAGVSPDSPPGHTRVARRVGGVAGRNAPPPAVASFDAAKAREHQEAWAKYLGVPVEMTNTIGMKLVLIPPGEFEMGSTAEEVDWAMEDAQRHKDAQGKITDTRYLGAIPGESPRHFIRITKPLYLGKYEVTQEQWEQVMGTNPSKFKGSKNPVDNVSWEDCQLFVKNVSEKCGVPEGSYGLPSEAQWEYACRAGSQGKWCFGDNESELGSFAWYAINAEKKTHPVGEKKPNAWGLCDMHGNIWEWCADWYDRDYYKASPATDPLGPLSGSGHAGRGGSWFNLSGLCRSTHRGNGLDFRITGLGLRVALALANKPAIPKTSTAMEDAFFKEVAALPPEEQVARVVAKLKDLNPDYDGKETHTIEKGKVTAIEFQSATLNDIAPVRALTSLEKFACRAHGNGRERLADLSPLKGLRLTELACTDTLVHDLSPLAGMPLTKVWCTLCPLKELTPLRGMPLQVLDCYGTRISDLSPLAGAPLSDLTCYATTVSDLSPLKGMPLHKLRIWGTKIRDLSPLRGLPLEELRVFDTSVDDLSPLRGMPLHFLACDGTKVTDLSPLKDTPIKGLTFDFDPKRDTDVLRSIKTLESINNLPVAEFWKQVEAGKIPPPKTGLEKI